MPYSVPRTAATQPCGTLPQVERDHAQATGCRLRIGVAVQAKFVDPRQALQRIGGEFGFVLGNDVHADLIAAP